MRYALLVKSHVSAYTRKDGTFVAAHEDKRSKKADDQSGSRPAHGDALQVQKNEYGISIVPVKVRVDQSAKKAAFSVNGGEAELIVPPYLGTHLSDLRSWLFRYIDEYISPLSDNEYIRVVHRKDDYEHLKKGTHRGSMNHATNEEEGGLSAAKSPEFAAKYAYYLTGKEIGKGSDGEPLLDVSTAKPKGRIMPYSTLRADYEKRLKEKAEKLGLSDEVLRVLRTNPYIFKEEQAPLAKCLLVRGATS